MDGIEKIIAKINTDANKEIAECNDQVVQKCDAILSAANADAAKNSEDILSKGERAAAERLERLKSAAQMKTRTLTLAAKQEVLGAAFDAALSNLQSLPEERYVDLLVDLAAKASTTKHEALVFSAEDREKIGERVANAVNERIGGSLVVSDETRAIRGGFVLIDGNTEVNCSFETLVARQREDLEQEVAHILFA